MAEGRIEVDQSRRPLEQRGLIAVVALAVNIVANTLANMESRGISTGFGFLESEAGFGIIAYGKLGGLELSYGFDLSSGASVILVAAVGYALSLAAGPVIRGLKPR